MSVNETQGHSKRASPPWTDILRKEGVSAQWTKGSYQLPGRAADWVNDQVVEEENHEYKSCHLPNAEEIHPGAMLSFLFNPSPQRLYVEGSDSS